MDAKAREMIVDDDANAWKDLALALGEKGHEIETAGTGREVLEKAEDSLRESEERFQRLTEAAFEGIVISDQGKILDVNDTLAKMFGYAPSEVIGRAVMELVAPESRELVATNIRSSHEEVYNHEALRKDGSTFPAEVHGRAISYKERLVRVTAVRDITERMQAEARLRKLSSAIEHSPSAVLIYGVGGLIEYVNPRLAQMRGYAPEEIIGTHISNLGDNTPGKDKQIWDTILAGDEWRGEILNCRKDGSSYWVFSSISSIRDSAGSITHFVENQEDITVRKRAEETLRWRNRELTLLNRVIGAATSTLEPEAVLETTCRELAKGFGVPRAGAALLDETGTLLRVVAEYLAEDGPIGLGSEIPVEGNLATQYVLEQKVPLAIYDAQHDPRMAPVHELMRQRNTVSMLIVPLIVDDSVVGTIGLVTAEPREFTQDEIALAANAAAAAAQVLEKARLYEETQESKESLIRSLAETARSQQLLLSVSQAAQAVQRARTAEEVYQTVGDEVAKLGYHAVVYTLTDDRANLIVSHMTFKPSLVRKIEKLVGFSAQDYRFPLKPGGSFERISNKRGTVFSERTADHIAEALPQPARPLAGRIAGMLGLKQSIISPLLIGNETFGLLGITGTGLSEADVPAVTALANQTAIALENARLIETERQRSAELARANAFIATLSQAAARLQSSLDLDQVMEALGADFKSLGLTYILSWLDEADGSLVVRYTSIESKALVLVEKFTGLKLDHFHILAQRVPAYADIVERQQAVFFSDAESILRTALPSAIKPLAGRVGRILGMTSDVSTMWLPLVVEERLLGIMGLWGPNLQEGDLPTASVFAGQLAAAMENARLFAEVKQQAEELEALAGVSTALRTALAQADMLPIVLDEVLTLLNAEGVALATRDSDIGEAVIELARGTWRVVTGLRISLDHTIIGHVFDSGQPVLYEDMPPSDLQSLRTGPLGGFSSAVYMPLIAQETVIGVLLVGRGEVLAQREVRLLTAIADIAANAIQRVRLYEQTVRHAAELESRVAERTNALNVINAELARANRAKDEFLANMSHELRTPLSNVLFRVEMLQRGLYGSLTEKQVRSVEVIDESSRHLLQLINDILDVSKIEAGKLELEILPIPVESLSHASLQFVKEIAQEKRIEIHTDIQPTVVQADRRLLKQILVNLLANAVKFTPEGGQVGLDVFADPEAELIRFVIWDTGIGIAEQDMPRLFEPFVQLNGGLKRRYEGTGLGLALVHRLTEMHGGSVTVRSEVGQGSRFTVSLPWQVDDQASGGQGQMMTKMLEQAIVSRVQPATILLVEDNEVLRSGLEDYLSLMGYRVVVARDGGEAIEQTREEKPDLILMDIRLPGMDGLEAIRLIRADTDSGAVPIVALTALAMTGDRERCIKAGASEYLSKPFEFEQLTKIIETLLDEAGSKEMLSR